MPKELEQFGLEGCVVESLEEKLWMHSGSWHKGYDHFSRGKIVWEYTYGPAPT